MPRAIAPIAAVLVALMALSHAIATPYNFAYEANTPNSFPEDEGWDRTIGGQGATRSIADGALLLASNDILVFDFYTMDMNGALDPDPGELFFAEWRLRIDQNSDPDFADAAINIARDSTGGPFGGADIGFNFFQDRVVATDGQEALFEQDIFHAFRLESQDMADFQFFIDGALAFEGQFVAPSTIASRVAWGDGSQGVASTSHWDYVRFGVVPEPSTVFFYCLAALPLLLRGEVPA